MFRGCEERKEQLNEGFSLHTSLLDLGIMAGTLDPYR